MNNIIFNINKISDFLGDKGPIILLLSTFILYIFTNNILIALIFFIGYYINLFINKLLKKIINDTRPLKTPKKNRMPSGHSQLIFYIFGFAYFISQLKYINIPYLNYLFVIYSLFLINTFYNCIIYKYHTIYQLIIGGILGVLISYLIVITFAI